jgi:hypothetical protein
VIGDRLLVSWQDSFAPTATFEVPNIVRVFDVRPLLEGRQPDAWRDLVYDGSARIRLAAIPESRDRAANIAFFDLRGRCTGSSMVWAIGAVFDSADNPRLDTRDVPIAMACNSNSGVAAPQPGIDRRLFIQHSAAQPIYRDGRLWVFESTGRDSRDSTSEIVWAELDVRQWPAVRVAQSGRVSGGAAYAYTPAVALDSAGNLAMVYTQSGSGEFLSAYYTGRLAADAPNTMRTPRVLKAGTRPFNWPELNPSPAMTFTDYAAAAVDPVDGSLWLAGLVPTSAAPASGRAELSEVWIGRLRPLR